MAKNEKSTSDFGSYLEANLSSLRTDFQVGDRVEGTITQIGRHTVFVDINARSDGILDREELLDDNDELTVSVGDRIEAFFTGWSDDCVRLTTRMTGHVADAGLEDAYQSGIPVEGRVTEERKGGYAVSLMGQTAFCPYSQIDIYKQEPATYLGQKLTFLIAEYAEDGRNIIVSRRRLLEQEKESKRRELESTLSAGDVMEGRVTRLMPFGAFVDLGGAEGLIHVSELGWSRNTKPEDVLAEGQDVTVKVLDVDWEKDRISLSLRHAQGDPWDAFLQNPTFGEGHHCTGTVTHIAQFGAFVEIQPGIEGLVHISRLGAGRRVNSPAEVVDVGDTVEVSILDIDPEKRRIALSMDDAFADMPQDAQDDGDSDTDTLRVGARLTGTVDGHRDFGVFVRLPGDSSGLLHVSQVELKGSTNPGKALYKMFPPESSIDVVVREIQGDRISLTLPETLEKEAETLTPQDLEDGGGKDLGSLEGLFGDLKL
jgi:small subunit ribosomal protein S1